MHRLIPSVKNYAWGSSQEKSLVKDIYVTNIAMLDGTNEQLEKIKTEKTWAEIWLGTHPSGMARLINGDPLTEKLGGELSFIFKVLSIEKCLSIQMHPDRAWAEKLHATDPANYPDPHPKPEMAIALDYLEAFCGYATPDELKMTLGCYPAFSEALAKDFPEIFTLGAGDYPTTLKSLLSFFLGLKSEDLAQFQALLMADIAKKTTLEHRDQVIAKINTEFGNDVGVLVSMTLKLVKLKPLEYIALGPFIPHAYISGNVLECMAPSDNVIRLGLTPKFKDVANFLAMFDYQALDDPLQRPVARKLESEGVQVLEYKNNFGEFFTLVLVTRTDCEGLKASNDDQWGVEIEGAGVLFNFGDEVEVNEVLVREFDFQLIENTKLEVRPQGDNIRLAAVGKNVRVSQVTK